MTHVSPAPPQLPRASPAPLRSHLGPMKETVSGVSPRLVPRRFQTLTFSIILRSQSAATIPLLPPPSAAKSAAFCGAIFMKTRRRTHLGCLYFVSRTAAPPFEIRQHFTLLPVHAGMHLAPPLLCNYGGCGGKMKEGKGARRQSATTADNPDNPARCSLEPHEVFRLAVTAAS